MTKITIIGAGSVGITISKRIAQLSDMDFELIYRSQNSYYMALEDGISSENLTEIRQAKFDGEFIIISVSDNDISSIVDTLSNEFGNKLQGKIVFHTSGTLPKEVLSLLLQHKVNIVAAHPFQTFADRNPNVLDGIAWGIDADKSTFEELSPIIRLLGSKPILLTEEAVKNKSLYHISAVGASNFMALAIEFAKEMAVETGISPDEFLPPIMQTTLQNNIRQFNTDFPAISGPIVRGDTETIAKHLAELGDSTHLKMYRNISRALALLAYEKKLISKEKYGQLINILGVE